MVEIDYQEWDYGDDGNSGTPDDILLFRRFIDGTGDTIEVTFNEQGRVVNFTNVTDDLEILISYFDSGDDDFVFPHYKATIIVGGTAQTIEIWRYGPNLAPEFFGGDDTLAQTIVL